MSVRWTERQIASWLCRWTFQKKHLVVVPNCSWPGSECDLLVVTMDRRIIDVEIKISRSDLKADATKDKWYESYDWRGDKPFTEWEKDKPRRQWPRRVWKHYYCLPAELWRDDLMPALGSPTSGVLLISERNAGGVPMMQIRVERPAKPCRDAQRLDPDDVLDIARSASLRMWDAYDLIDQLNRERPRPLIREMSE